MRESFRIERGVARPAAIAIFVNHRRTDCYPGETLATALLAAGVPAFRRTASNAPRAVVCNMGVCFDCLVQVEGQGQVRSCLTLVTPDMRVILPGISDERP